MTDPGPITAALEAEVERELRDHGIVVWLDRDAHYTPFVDVLAERYERGDFFAPVATSSSEPFAASRFERRSRAHKRCLPQKTYSGR